MRNILFIIFIPLSLFSQIDNSSFNSLNFNSSSRSISLGGDVISIVDDDVSLACVTPSLLNQSMNRKIAFNFVDYFSDINYLSVHFATNVSDNLMLFSGLDAINYGDFIGTDDVGNQISTFSANDQILTFGLSKILSDKFILGSNLRILNSNLETYHALSISSNISVTYNSQEERLVLTFLMKNFGRSIKSYTSEKEDLPFELQFGLSKYLEHLPFRYYLHIHNLQQYDISNDFSLNEIYDPLTNSIVYKDESVAKKLLRHLSIGGELNPFRKSFFLRLGFNFQRREDLDLVSNMTFSGFSFGTGFSIKNIQINYSRSSYHAQHMINTFSVITNLSNFGL